MSKQHKTRKSTFKSVGSKDQALTVYQGFGIVQETREIRLSNGTNEIQLGGVPQQYVRNSLKVLGHNAADLTINGASYDAATLTGQELLSRLEGQHVELKFRTASGRERWTQGTLLHFLGDKIVLGKDNGKSSIITAADIGEVIFEGAVPEELSKTACLVLSADSTAAGACNVRVLYHTRGLNWQAIHTATYDEKNGVLTDFESWAAIDNGSGAAFQDARLTLLAGNIQAAQDSFGNEAAPMMAMAGGMSKRAAMRNVQAESVGEQKAYPVPGAFSIGVNQSKQVPLFAAEAVPVTREFFVPPMPLYMRAQQQDAALTPVSIRLRLTNDEEHHLGTALAAGEVSIYQRDSRGDAQLTGTAQIDHVASGETFGFVIGSSTDVKAERKLVESTTGSETEDSSEHFPIHTQGGPTIGLPGGSPADRARREAVETAPADEDEAPKYRDETWEVTVHNFKTDTAVEVSVIEDLPGKHEILEQTHEFRKERSNRYSATVSVPASEKATLRYKVRVWEE